MALAIIVGIILFGIGLPAWNAVLTKEALHSDWFNPQLRLPYGSFYSSYNTENIKFQFWVYLKKDFGGWYAWWFCTRL